MPQLAFASTFWESYDALEKDVEAGVRKVMRSLHVSWSGTPSPFLPISAAPEDAARRW